jgi:hypothetical protein
MGYIVEETPNKKPMARNLFKDDTVLSDGRVPAMERFSLPFNSSKP